MTMTRVHNCEELPTGGQRWSGQSACSACRAGRRSGRWTGSLQLQWWWSSCWWWDHCDNQQDVHGPMGKHMGWVMLGPLQQLKSSSSTWALWLSKLSTRDFRFKHLCSYTGCPKNAFFLFWTLFWPFLTIFHDPNTYLNIILCSNHHFLAIRID